MQEGLKIGLTISRLARGGAEQQLMRLAQGLAAQGHKVEVMCYGGASALDDELIDAGIAVRTCEHAGWKPKYQAMRRWLRSYEPDVVHGFMKRASSLAVMAAGVRRRCAVLASDFSTATYNRRNPELWASLPLFGFADGVATQTELNRRSLELLAPWLRKRTHVIRNGLDTGRFHPPVTRRAGGIFRFCVVGSVYRVKNPQMMVEAVALLRERGRDGFQVDWHGRYGLAGDDQPSDDYLAASARVSELGLQPWLVFHGETRDVVSVYQSADALLHISLQEGFPNAVVEAMACGLPIIGSAVSDLPLVVDQAANGRIVNARDAGGLADAMEWMMDLERGQRLAMGERSRDLAVRWFNQDRFVDEYIALYQSMCRKRAAGASAEPGSA